MHHRHVAGIEPVTGEIEIRAITFLQSEHIAIEIARALQIGAGDGEMFECFEGHGGHERLSRERERRIAHFPVVALLKGTPLSTRMSCGRPSTRSAMMLRRI